MQKRLKVEGSPGAMMVQLMRQYGHNQDVNIETATVVALPPDLEIRLDADGILIRRDEITVADHLLASARDMTIDGVRRAVTMHENLAVGDVVIVVSLPEKMRYYVIDKAVIL